MSSKRKITDPQCNKWIYGPQVSPKNHKYIVGGIGIWENAFESCILKREDLYKRGVTPDFLIDKIDKSSIIYKTVKNALQESESILDVLLIFSAFINALGILENQKYSNKASINLMEEMQTKLSAEYSKLYNNTENILENKDHINIFVHPDDFIKLTKGTIHKPNIVYDAGKDYINKLPEQYKILTERINHPIPSTIIKKITVDVKNKLPNCVAPFENITNKEFKPVADMLIGYCSLLNQPEIKINPLADYTTFNDLKNMDIISRADVAASFNCFEFYKPNEQQPHPTLIIRQKPMTYLSQLFQHIYINLFKPFVILPKSNNIDDILFAAKENIKINNISSYYYELIPFFRTQIKENSFAGFIYYIKINDKGQEYLDDTPVFDNIFDFIKNAASELFDLGVFKPMKGEPDRYELNTEFDIGLLECFNNLPNDQIKNEMKNDITNIFYRFVGNFLTFLRINIIPLKHKISRLYFIRQYSLFSIMINPQEIERKDTPHRSMEIKLAIISIYFTEKASPSFKQTIIQMMENPEYAKEKGITMNNNLKIVKSDFPIYNEDPKKFINNVIDYMYKNAYKHYTEGNKTTDVPLDISSPKFEPNKNFSTFFSGLTIFEDFSKSSNIFIINKNPLVSEKTPFNLILNILRKIDLIAT